MKSHIAVATDLAAALAIAVHADEQVDERSLPGAHFDSWNAGTGATDNAAGVVMMEALRILKAISARPRRTVRLALWDAGEGGHLGSSTYVLNHFADPRTMSLKPEHAKLAAYYNFDNGTGKIRGVFLQGNEAVMPIFAAWLRPFRELGASALAVQRVGGTDHLDFDHVGLPAFQFVQHPIDYEARTHQPKWTCWNQSRKPICSRPPPSSRRLSITRRRATKCFRAWLCRRRSHVDRRFSRAYALPSRVLCN
jgi:peptidase M28-like protein